MKAMAKEPDGAKTLFRLAIEVAFPPDLDTTLQTHFSTKETLFNNAIMEETEDSEVNVDHQPESHPHPTIPTITPRAKTRRAEKPASISKVTPKPALKPTAKASTPKSTPKLSPQALSPAENLMDVLWSSSSSASSDFEEYQDCLLEEYRHYLLEEYRDYLLEEYFLRESEGH